MKEEDFQKLENGEEMTAADKNSVDKSSADKSATEAAKDANQSWKRRPVYIFILVGGCTDIVRTNCWRCMITLNSNQCSDNWPGLVDCIVSKNRLSVA